MQSIMDRFILILFASTTLVQFVQVTNSLVPILIVITLSCLNEYLEKEKWNLIVLFGFGITCLFVPNMLLLSPVLLYDLFETKYKYYSSLLLVPFLYHFDSLTLYTIAASIIVGVMAYWLKKNTTNHRQLQKKYIQTRDNLTEVTNVLESKLSELLNKQDDEATMATLNERNRIAREIHDNVGHFLSCSILQLGAMITISKDNDVKENLKLLKDTLTKGMNSIRLSVHDLQDDAVDLYQHLNSLILSFQFCETELVYHINEPLPVSARYSVIAIVKEALSNVIKHSNASQVSIALYEHPKLYQLIIRDNGTKVRNSDSSYGMGLENMRQRVAGLNGIINITQTDGFRIFVSFPRGNKL